MLDTQELSSKIKYENVFNEIDEYISKKYNFPEEIKRDKQLYWDEISKLICSIYSMRTVPSFRTVPSSYIHQTYIYDLLFSNDLHDFIKLNYNNLNFEILSMCNFKVELKNFYINNLNWVFQDFKRLIHSFKFVKYTEEKLELVLTFYPYLISKNTDILLENEKLMYNEFWINLSLYQNLTCTFIQKYFLVFLNPKIAYNLSISNNQLYSCNFYIIQKIKAAANCYKNK